jgi:hypothetical protein
MKVIAFIYHRLCWVFFFHIVVHFFLTLPCVRNHGQRFTVDWFGPDIPSPDDMFITNEVDLPGWDATYDDVNLHFHGMQIVPHLFYPEGTANPNGTY